MNQAIQAQTAPAPTATGWGVDLSKGTVKGTVSQQWATRPDDEKFLSLSDLEAHVLNRRDDCREDVVKTGELLIAGEEDGALNIEVPGDGRVEPTHWSFGQLCGLAEAPASYMRRLPAPLAADCLRHGLDQRRDDQLKVLTHRNGGPAELRAVNSPTYGRIWDADCVQAVRRIAGNGTGDATWKIPGLMKFGSGYYDPEYPISKATTTLYASDRDVFMFLVDDRNPIEIGKLANGTPDLLFRGFYMWNSETGSATFGLSTMYLRAVCQNRNLWGVEDFSELVVRHNKNAPDRFIAEAAPALLSYQQASTAKVIGGVAAARAAKVAGTDEERVEFLTRRPAALTIGQARKALACHLEEEGRPAETVWDMAQAITAYARSIPHADSRTDVERRAKLLLDKVA